MALKQNTLSATNLLDASFIGAGTVTSTQFGYLNTLTSNVQTQLNNKQTNISGSNRVAASFVANGLVDNTTFNYLQGVTSSIQTQISAKANSASPALSGNTTYAASSTVDFTNCTVSNFPLITPFAIGYVSSTRAISNGKGPTGLTASRQALGYFKISWTNAYTTTGTYVVNTTILYTTNSLSSCSVQKSTVATTSFYVACRDNTNTAFDVDFMFVVY